MPLSFAAPLALAGGVGASLFGLVLAFGLPANIETWDAWGVLMSACYFPLALWGPTLLIVTVDYIRRRRTTVRHQRIAQLAA